MTLDSEAARVVEPKTSHPSKHRRAGNFIAIQQAPTTHLNYDKTPDKQQQQPQQPPQHQQTE